MFHSKQDSVFKTKTPVLWFYEKLRKYRFKIKVHFFKITAKSPRAKLARGFVLCKCFRVVHIIIVENVLVLVYGGGFLVGIYFINGILLIRVELFHAAVYQL